jgi:hypothetical protein
MNDMPRPTTANQTKKPTSLVIETIDSVALARLVKEVQNNGASPVDSPTAYNRTYNRHNR